MALEATTGIIAMIDKLLKAAGLFGLYFCASMFLAMLIVGTYLKFAWGIDKNKWNMAVATLQGYDTLAIKKAVQERIQEMSYDEVLRIRATGLREKEAEQNIDTSVVGVAASLDERRINEQLLAIEQKRKDFDDTVKKQLDKYKTAGLMEETRAIEAMEAEDAKDVILRLIKDHAATERVLIMLLAMEEKKRDEIYAAMQGEEELKELCRLLQRIGDGEPMSKVAKDAAK